MGAFDDYQTKKSLVIVYTGEGKGKTSASIGLVARALGHGLKTAYVQFIKHWQVGEHEFFARISEIYPDNFTFYKGGKGFFNAGKLSAKGVSEAEHKHAAKKTLEQALEFLNSGEYDLVVLDEINNAVHDKLLNESDMLKVIRHRHHKTSICLTGRNFPLRFIRYADIATNMTKLYHHFDDKYLANKGIDF